MKLYIHLGYPKTATSFLQRSFFEKSSNINYLGKPFDKNLMYLINKIVKSKNFSISKLKFKKKEFIRNNLSQSKINLISQESFFSIFYGGQNNIEKTIKRLRLFFKQKKLDIKVFIVIRSQQNLILSLFSESYLKINKKFHIKNLQELIEKLNTKNKSKIFIDNLNYYNRINYLNSVFGKKNVKVFLYEDLKYNFNKFKKELIKYLGLNLVNESKYLKNKIIHASIKKNQKYFSKEKYFFTEAISKTFIYKLLKKILGKKLRSYLKDKFDFYYTKNVFEISYKNKSEKKIIKNYYSPDNKKIGINKNIFKKLGYI